MSCWRGSARFEGRLLDEFGDPVPGVVVQIAQKGSAALGLPFFVSTPSVAATGPTDDRGWFRAPGLFPGDYYLIAVPPPFEQSWMTGFAPTFYPGSTTADAATPISIVSGRDVYDARFAIAGARTRTVTGRIVDGSGKPVEKASFVLMPVENGEVRAMVMVRSAADIDGTFTIRDVPDGTYVVQGFGPRLFGVSAIELPAANREPRPVSVTVKPLTTARGRVVFDSEASTKPQNPKSVALWFQPTNFTSGPVGTIHNAATIGPDWSFEIPNLAWFGVLRVTTPSGWALLRVRHEGRDITDTPFDFQSADVSGIEVVLTNRLGTVSGTVTDAGQPATGAVVLIFGADDTNTTHMSRTAASGRTDERGAFKVEGLVPGRYLRSRSPRSRR
jgi:protocatechuate 3,4-dioxygenase beta subunit